MADFDQAIKLNSTDVRPYNNRGLTYLGKGLYAAAIRDFDKVIELDPRQARAYNNRGIAYASKGELDQAIREFDQGIELNPDYAEAYFNRGIAYRSKDDYDQAIRDFDRAIALNPKFSGAYTGIVYALLQQGRHREVLKYCHQAIQLGCDGPKLLNDLAWVLATHEDAQLRNGAEAVRLAERACRRTGYKIPAVLDTLAAAYAEVGQFDRAVETAQRAIQLALVAGNEKLAKDIQSHLELYKAKRPYRQSLSLEGPGTPELKHIER